VKLQCMQILLLLATLVTSLSAQMSVAISTSAPQTLPLGSTVTWTASVSGAGPGTLAYRFRVRHIGGDFRTVVDYGPKVAFTWTTIDGEGGYEVEVSFQNYDTGEQASATTTQVFTALAGQGPVLNLSANPLVYIYSAPPCTTGARMRVGFQAQDGRSQWTPYKTCLPGSTSMNYYVAGLAPGIQYTGRHEIELSRSVSLGPVLSLTPGGTDAVSAAPWSMIGPDPPPPGLLLQSLFGQPSVATDMTGRLVWSAPADLTYLAEPVTGGTFLGIGEDPQQNVSQQFFREFDLAGITVAETNAAQINRQLTALGFHTITGFHHDVRKLPGGGYLVLAGSERLLTDVQGPGEVDVLGDMILALNQNLQVTWVWDAFDHLDPYRLATLQEHCAYPAGVSCAPFYLRPIANDWLHGNAVSLTPDGNILYSARHQDWVIKIDYARGKGRGDILWRLGPAGDFRMASTGLNPWFSHQHDPNFEANGTVMLVFDNGNVRHASDPTAHSRGQALEIDVVNRVVTPLLNVDLGVYSAALGSAQLLLDGSYHFDAGFLLSQDATGAAQYAADSFQVGSNGTIDFALHFSALEYRTFRMPDLYTAPAGTRR
jgi:arylsulfate sulfotransferase